MASGFLNPPTWDAENFDLFFREAEAWKLATAAVTGLKGVMDYS